MGRVGVMEVSKQSRFADGLLFVVYSGGRRVGNREVGFCNVVTAELHHLAMPTPTWGYVHRATAVYKATTRDMLQVATIEA